MKIILYFLFRKENYSVSKIKLIQELCNLTTIF